MIRIAKMTDYAMLILSQMAKTPSTVLSSAALAELLHLTSPTVSKILKMLSEANLVNSLRGAEGGYLLAKPAIEISITEIIQAMEGSISLTECCEAKVLCTLESMCIMRENWRKINNKVNAMLSKLTIQDMLTPLPQGLFDAK